MMIREVGGKRGRGDEGVGEKLQQKSKKNSDRGGKK